MTARENVCYVGLGANLGDPVARLCAAAQAIEALPGCSRTRRSSLYRSAPQETLTVQPDYFNAVVSFATERPAPSLWQDLQAIERALGRTREGGRNAARIIDIDFLLYGDTELDSATLVLPHPRIAQRAFVLRPLLELDAAIAIPGVGAAQVCLDRVATQRIDRVEHKEWHACS
jgi:2-amino-4-hydroxy-6-hydroxymethyldihydropteridine diphosphokinase